MMYLRLVLLTIVSAVVGLIVIPASSSAQSVHAMNAATMTSASTPSYQTVESLSADRIASQRRHLTRVAAWGGTNLAGGTALWAFSDREDWNSFGLQSALWGAVNVGIAAVAGLTGSDEPTGDFAEALRAEQSYSDILLLNLGLNVGYMGIGGAMVIAANQGVSRADAWRGHGSAIILQGLGLFVLDLISWLASQDRRGSLVGIHE